MTRLILVLLLTGVPLVALNPHSDFFCEQFYNDISSRDPHRFYVDDNVPPGTIIKEFRHHSHERNTVSFTVGDLNFINFDRNRFAIVTKAPIYEKADQTLQIMGNCSEFLKRINHGYVLPLTVLVEVRDVNDPPVFGNLPANLRIKESVRVGSLLYKVEMKPGLDVRDEFSANILRLMSVKAEGHPQFNAAKFFSLDTDGNVHLLQPIDYEKDPRKFELTIHAQDLAEPPLSATSTLTFYIEDIDDMKPRFHHKYHTALVVGERPVETPECRKTEPAVIAEDQDIRAKADVHYAILSGAHGTDSDWSQLFKLDETTGFLCQLATVHRTLHDPVTGRLTFSNYTFRIKGYQVDNPRKYDTATVFVNVKDSNEHAPKFNRKLYRATVKEFPEVTEGQEVIQVEAKDKDHGQNAIFEYRLQGPSSQFFNIDPDTGWITIKEPARFDREIYNHFEFQVKAVETSTLEKLESVARILIKVEDINDNTPEFERYRYVYTVKDNLRPNQIIHSPSEILSAHDRDAGENGRIMYKITGVRRMEGEASLTDLGRFFIDPEEGDIRLTGTLNDLRRRRDHPEFRLQVTATDQAKDKKNRKSASVDVFIRVVEANDFLPIITPKRGPVFVNESAPIGSSVYAIKVKDRDGDEDVYLKYKIIHGNKGGVFKITQSGRVSVHKPLDREKTDAYKLRIEVSDGKNVKTTSLKIQVVDANDNSPLFSRDEYVFNLPEEPPLGLVVGQVKAKDPDGGPAGVVKYSLKPGPGAEIFHINSRGVISVQKSSPLLDREINSAVSLRVFASDMGSPPKQSVADVTVNIVDVNDNTPAFTSHVYHGWLLEDDNDPKPQVITMDIPINATDLDAELTNRKVRYSLSGNGSDVFTMDSRHADIFTATIGRMDAERRQQYNLIITARDQDGRGLASEAKLVIDVRDQNDNAPQFRGRRRFTTYSNTSPGVKVAALEAIDRDVTKPNNQLIYILKEGGHGKFTVDYLSGEVTLVEALDKEPILPEYHLNIQALDGGSPRLTNETTLVIKVPINRPPIINEDSTQLQVKEDLPPGSVVGAMRAQDLDNEENGVENNLHFFLMDDRVPFEVNAQGLITTKDFLDREVHPKYEFQLYVKDEGRPPMTSSARVTIVVDDVNDHAPEFLNSYYEGTVVEDNRDPKPGQIVKMSNNITTLDRDATADLEEVRYSLHGKDSQMFSINPRTAQIQVSRLGYGLIDREKMDTFKLKVRATDRQGEGLSNETNVVIHVIDVNDAKPEFGKQSKPLVVSETVEVGQVIGTLQARDEDATEPNNMIIYTLENDPFGKFSVDSHTGEIRALTGVFYPPRQGSYQLRVAATDMGYPPQRSETQVEIIMNKTNFNDFKPEFFGENIFYVHEQVPIGTLIGTISILDEDVGTGEEALLSLENKDGKEVPFRIDDRTGEIRNTRVLDFDGGTRAFTFNVVAQDRGDPPMSARISVGVILDDINDNPPRFTQKRYHHRVSDMFPTGTVVATPFAYDDIDSGNSVYRYSMTGPEVGMYFTMDPVSGIVRTTENLENMIEDQVSYTLLAEDIYNERLHAEAELLIDIYHQRGGSRCCCKVPCDSTSSGGP